MVNKLTQQPWDERSHVAEDGLTIGIVRMRPDVPKKSPVMPEVIRLLRERGITIEMLFDDGAPADLRSLPLGHDLYVFMPRKTEFAESMAGTLEAAGCTLLHPYRVLSTLRNKIVTMAILEAAGLPVPATYVARRASDLVPLLEDGPLILKPYRGSRGQGIRIVQTADELEETGIEGLPLLAQRYHQPDGKDLKIYCVGEHVRGVLRTFPATSYEEKLGQPFELSPEIVDIAQRCAKALGIEVLGFDIIFRAGRPYVVDASSFPGFKGVPDGPALLADFMESAARKARHKARGQGLRRA